MKAQSDPPSVTAANEAFIQAEGQDYAPIDEYEGRHRWDPKYTWSAQEEREVVRKIDLKICSWCCLTFFALQLDRANVRDRTHVVENY